MSSVPPSSPMSDEEFERVVSYGKFLGFDPLMFPSLLPILREGLNAPLPQNWVVAVAENGEVVYCNAVTGVVLNEHPCDRIFKRRCELTMLNGKDPMASLPLHHRPLSTSSSSLREAAPQPSTLQPSASGSMRHVPDECSSSSDDDNNGDKSNAKSSAPNSSASPPPRAHGEADFEFIDNREHPQNVRVAIGSSAVFAAPQPVLQRRETDVRDKVAAKYDAEVQRLIARIRQASGPSAEEPPPPSGNPGGRCGGGVGREGGGSGAPSLVVYEPLLGGINHSHHALHTPRPTSSNFHNAATIKSLEQQIAALRSEKETLERKFTEKLHSTPAEFVCPITGDVLRDPVVTADGYTYERAAIAKWLKRHDTSPCTNLPLDHKFLAPNLALKAQIAEFLERTKPGV